MSSLWELSTDAVVTTFIAVGIGMLAIAWLFAGRRPTQTSALEHRRLAGREAEVTAAPVAPIITATMDDMRERPFSEPAPEEIDHTASGAPEEEALQPAPPEPASATLVLEAAAPKPKPSAPSPPAPRSPEQASAMSIAAALVRHDKRDPAPSDDASQETAAEPVSRAGGDDLTAIDGIDAKLAKEMNDLGVRYFDQISDWSPDHAAWIASRLSSSITSAQRNAWIEGAKALSARTASAAQSRASQAR